MAHRRNTGGLATGSSIRLNVGAPDLRTRRFAGVWAGAIDLQPAAETPLFYVRGTTAETDLLTCKITVAGDIVIKFGGNTAFCAATADTNFNAGMTAGVRVPVMILFHVYDFPGIPTASKIEIRVCSMKGGVSTIVDHLDQGAFTASIPLAGGEWGFGSMSTLVGASPASSYTDVSRVGIEDHGLAIYTYATSANVPSLDTMRDRCWPASGGHLENIFDASLWVSTETPQAYLLCPGVWTNANVNQSFLGTGIGATISAAAGGTSALLAAWPTMTSTNGMTLQQNSTWTIVGDNILIDPFVDHSTVYTPKTPSPLYSPNGTIAFGAASAPIYDIINQTYDGLVKVAVVGQSWAGGYPDCDNVGGNVFWQGVLSDDLANAAGVLFEGIVDSNTSAYRDRDGRRLGFDASLGAETWSHGTITQTNNTLYGWTRFAAGGRNINHTADIQSITINATGGFFKLSYGGQETADLAWNISTANLQTALQGLSSIGSGNATVSGTPGGTYYVTLTGLLRDTLPHDLITATDTLTGGAGTVTIAQFSSGLRLSIGGGNTWSGDNSGSDEVYTATFERFGAITNSTPVTIGVLVAEHANGPGEVRWQAETCKTTNAGATHETFAGGVVDLDTFGEANATGFTGSVVSATRGTIDTTNGSYTMTTGTYDSVVVSGGDSNDISVAEVNAFADDPEGAVHCWAMWCTDSDGLDDIAVITHASFNAGTGQWTLRFSGGWATTLPEAGDFAFIGRFRVKRLEVNNVLDSTDETYNLVRIKVWKVGGSGGGPLRVLGRYAWGEGLDGVVAGGFGCGGMAYQYHGKFTQPGFPERLIGVMEADAVIIGNTAIPTGVDPGWFEVEIDRVANFVGNDILGLFVPVWIATGVTIVADEQDTTRTEMVSTFEDRGLAVVDCADLLGTPVTQLLRGHRSDMTHFSNRGYAAAWEAARGELQPLVTDVAASSDEGTSVSFSSEPGFN